MNDTQFRTLTWMANEDTGISSRTLAFWLAFDIFPKESSHPLDPADFNRCLNLLDQAPDLRQELPRMSKISAEWETLVLNWSELEELFLAEAGLNWRKSKRAPKTLARMRELFEMTRELNEEAAANA
jgi:hypothetical protein